jgi:CRP/FNR family transcriptional regulator, anaerobic regulatory protein
VTDQSAAGNSGVPSNGGPSIIASAPWDPSDNAGHPLATKERAQLALISTIAHFKRGDTIYKSGDSAGAVFNIITGVVKSYRDLPDKGRHIVGFLFPGDLIGLPASGLYVNSAEAVTAVTAYRMPVGPLEARLRQDSELEFHIISKLCHDLRTTQHHALLLSRQHATAKVALFLQMLDAQQAAHADGTADIYLPMTRRDIADYLGLSPEGVSRSFRSLAARGAIAFRDRRHVRTAGRAQLAAILSAG